MYIYMYTTHKHLIYTAKNLNKNIAIINKELEVIKNWCNQNKLTLNVDKTNFIVI